MLTVTYAECHYADCHYAECRYAECHYAECRYAECRGAAPNLVLIVGELRRSESGHRQQQGRVRRTGTNLIKLFRRQSFLTFSIFKKCGRSGP